MIVNGSRHCTSMAYVGVQSFDIRVHTSFTVCSHIGIQYQQHIKLLNFALRGISSFCEFKSKLFRNTMGSSTNAGEFHLTTALVRAQLSQ